MQDFGFVQPSSKPPPSPRSYRVNTAYFRNPSLGRPERIAHVPQPVRSQYTAESRPTGRGPGAGDMEGSGVGATYLGVGGHSGGVDIGERVAGAVVAVVLGGARGEAADGATGAEKGGVVGAVGHGGRGDDAAGGREGAGEQVFECGGAGRRGDAELAAVAVEDAEEAAANHVEVEVGHDGAGVGGAEAVDVVRAAQQALLLGRPEGEADAVPRRAEAREGACEFEEKAAARGVVVDARPVLDAVQVRAELPGKGETVSPRGNPRGSQG